MLSKILAVVVAAVVLSIGGYAYWDYARSDQVVDHPNVCSDEPAPAPTPSCCQQPSRTSTEAPCCSAAGDSGTTEVLSIQPREVIK